MSDCSLLPKVKWESRRIKNQGSHFLLKSNYHYNPNDSKILYFMPMQLHTIAGI